MKFNQFGENKMEQNLLTIFWTRKFWKIRAFDYNQYIILIMYTNARFQPVGTTSEFGTKFAQNCALKS